MKKLLAIMLAILFILTLGACTDNEDENDATSSTKNDSVSSQVDLTPDGSSSVSVTSSETAITSSIDSTSSDSNSELDAVTARINKGVSNLKSLLPTSEQNAKKRLASAGYADDEIDIIIDWAQVDWKKQALDHVILLSESGYGGKSKMIEYLQSSRYSQSQIEYAMANCGDIWNETAARCFEKLAFSQIFYENRTRKYGPNLLLAYGFTEEQAEYGIKNTKVDWKEVAKKIVGEMVVQFRDNGCSPKALKKSLESYEFTSNEIEYAIKNNDINWNVLACNYATLYHADGYGINTREGIRNFLIDEGFTEQNIEYTFRVGKFSFKD